MNAFADSFAALNNAYGEPIITGVLRQSPEDFVVEEILGFEPEGEGEHVFLWIEKRGSNTQFVADKIAKFSGVAAKQVSFSGMKDRWAVTRQWFSVQLPGMADPDWALLNDEEITVLKSQRHLRKLRRGVHRGNRFRLTLREVDGDLDALKIRVAEIAKSGVPNYFGEQRFGRGFSNMSSAVRWFEGAFKPRRNQQSLFLSAARSFIFNELLSARVAADNWCQALTGELFMLNGSHSIFASNEPDMHNRMSTADVHATGPMYGKPGSLRVSDQVADLEQQIVERYPVLTQGLLAQGLKAERRSLRLMPENLQVNYLPDQQALVFDFALASGSFATAVLAEMVDYRNVATPATSAITNSGRENR